MYLNWSRAGWECEESEYGWRAVTVRCKWCSLPLLRLCVRQHSGLQNLPRPASFPLHSELSVSSSLPLAEEMADIDRASSGGMLQSKHLGSKMPFGRYLHSPHFSNSVSFLNWPKMPSRVSLCITRLFGARGTPLFGWLKTAGWTTIAGTVTKANHLLSTDITKRVERIQFSWPHLTRDTPLVLLWPGRHWNNIRKCCRGITHRQKRMPGPDELWHWSSRNVLAVSLPRGAALSPEEVVRLHVWMRATLWPTISSLSNAQRMCWPTLPLVEHQLYTHTHTHTHTHTLSNYKSQRTLSDQSGPLKVLAPVFVPVINWPINVCLFWTPMDIVILGTLRERWESDR